MECCLPPVPTGGQSSYTSEEVMHSVEKPENFIWYIKCSQVLKT
jgi:hypothetical protein